MAMNLGDPRLRLGEVYGDEFKTHRQATSTASLLMFTGRTSG